MAATPSKVWEKPRNPVRDRTRRAVPMTRGRRRRMLGGMATMALLDLPDGPLLRPVTLRERIAARVRFAALDRALAQGARPDADVALTLHVRRLIAPRTRRRPRAVVGSARARPRC